MNTHSEIDLQDTQAQKSNSQKKVLLFSEGASYFNHNRILMRAQLGGKGAGLAEMTYAQINVPPGFTITTPVCQEYYNQNTTFPDQLMDEVMTALKAIEQQLGSSLGHPEKPLLLSVRSGAKFSMPGMMDTILNLGLNDKTVEALSQRTQNPRFAWDSYRRFIQMFSSVVFDIRKDKFEQIIHDHKLQCGLEHDTQFTDKHWRSVVDSFKTLIKKLQGREFPQSPEEQLKQAIEAVFKSWNNPRAIYYRNLNKIDHQLGTAVNIQSMVFGNLGDHSATGVCFTRNPSTGDPKVYGEYLINAQGEDVVAGIRTPKPIEELASEMPEAYTQLKNTLEHLEKHYQDMQDVEFTIQEGKLFILQTRNGKRTAIAAVKIGVEMVAENLITKQDAVNRIEPTQLFQLLLPSFETESKENAMKAGKRLAIGLNASPGAAQGEVVFDPDEAEQLARQGCKVILVRVETCPDDIHGIVPAQGVLTSRGGMTSHAAVVARGMGKPCVVGCETLKVEVENNQMLTGDQVVRKGDWISIDGTTGEVFLGEIATHHPHTIEEFQQLLSWADSFRQLSVRTNADTPADAALARQMGAEGIGLCRTEHMFISQDRLPIVQAMILAETQEDRQSALDQLLPMQREDFIGIFKAMHALPVTIRLLDPPFHEFLPNLEALLIEVTQMKAKGEANAAFWKKEALLEKVKALHEANPMMGLRGCRLGLLHPEITQMQVRAIFEAACLLTKEGIQVFPEVMIPLIGHANELKLTKLQLESVAQEVMKTHQVNVQYQFGTMIEIPRACMVADELAESAQFFSFGTNDLTQMTFGYSRDDAESKFLQKYIEGLEWKGETHKILKYNPFEVLDQDGVGKLMKLAVKQGRSTRPDLKTGICGEHGGDPSSIGFANEIGLNYVSCSPYRVPVARLAAAQACLSLAAKNFSDA